jgi:hypothetical protein
MKTHLALALILLFGTNGLQAKEAHRGTNPPAAEAQAEKPTPASILAAQVSEIASSTDMSRKSQAKLITSTVRAAIIAAIEGIKNPEEKLQLALELAGVAAQAAPRFAETITQAVESIPAISRIEGAVAQVKAAVKAGVQAADEPETAIADNKSGRRPAKPEFGGNNGDVRQSPSH